MDLSLVVQLWKFDGLYQLSCFLMFVFFVQVLLFFVLWTCLVCLNSWSSWCNWQKGFLSKFHFLFQEVELSSVLVLNERLVIANYHLGILRQPKLCLIAYQILAFCCEVSHIHRWWWQIGQLESEILWFQECDFLLKWCRLLFLGEQAGEWFAWEERFSFRAMMLQGRCGEVCRLPFCIFQCNSWLVHSSFLRSYQGLSCLKQLIFCSHKWLWSIQEFRQEELFFL